MSSSKYEFGRLWADAWCAAFVWKKVREADGGLPFPMTERYFRLIEHKGPHGIQPWMIDEIKRLSKQHQFFHWHLAFPDVFRLPKKGEGAENELCGWDGGFDVMLGNPPWKMTEDDSRLEGDSGGEVCAAPESAITLVRERAFYARSNRFPLAARNRLQMARLFAELFTINRNVLGSAGMIVPSTVTVNSFDRPLWTSWLERNQIRCVWDFVNTEPLVEEVDSRQKFAVIVLYSKTEPGFHARCWMKKPEQLKSEKDEVVFLTQADLLRYSGNELALPHFTRRADLSLLASAISRFGRVVNGPPSPPEGTTVFEPVAKALMSVLLLPGFDSTRV